MFYYPTVLRRHTGCFSTIWLVATKGIRVPRRDFLKVNVKSICDDIMDYVLEQVPPPAPGLPRPRFSLYLSSQLQYGVIVVYHRQCVILLEELQSIIGQLVKQRTSQKIDMDDHSRQALLFPDALSLLEETEGASDPLFGVMDMQGAIPSPTTLIQMGQEYLREASAELSEPAAPTAAAAAALESGITASPDSITLRETEQVAISPAEFEGVELADHHPDTIDFLLAQMDHFPEEDIETAREEVTRAEQEMDREGREGEPAGSTIELQPTTLSSEDAILLPQEEPGLPVERPRPPPGQLTPIALPTLPLPSPPSVAKERAKRLKSLELEDVPPPEVKARRRRKKRQLIFFDPETQISQEVLQQQIDNPLTETMRPLFPSPASHRRIPAAELLSNPCTLLPEEVQSLWRQAATVVPLSGSDLQVGERGPDTTDDSEKERECEMVEMAEMAEREEGHELSPKEVPRELAESEMFGISGHESLLLEGSDQREQSREISPIYASEREGSTVSRSTLRDIPEVMEDIQGRLLEESPGLTELEVAPVPFQSLLPPDTDRRAVSNIFHRLLGILSSRKVRAEQDMSYGEILILPGPNYEEVHLT